MPLNEGRLDELLQPTPEGLEAPPQQAKTGRLKKRGPLPVPWIRIPLPWCTKQRRGKWLLPAEMRLFCWLIHKTGEGQRSFPVTDKTAAELGLSARARRRVLARLEARGAIRIERTGHNAPNVWLVWLSG